MISKDTGVGGEAPSKITLNGTQAPNKTTPNGIQTPNKITPNGIQAHNKTTPNGIQEQPKEGEDGEVEGSPIAGEAVDTLKNHKWKITRQTAMRGRWEGICQSSTEGETDTFRTLEEEEDIEVVKDQ